MQLSYRADIDGLRGLAILLVLFYHAGLPYFPAGFIGVDIFFVISGFLISSIIKLAMDRGQFSLIDFYRRRLWRLQPLYIALLFITSLLCLLYFLPDDLNDYFLSARKTSLFLSNQHFLAATKGYFAANVDQLPLLHSWSLSIEWQAYLLLPLLLVLLHRLIPKSLQNWALLSLVLLSLAVSLHQSKLQPEQSYFQFSSRLFEFILGAALLELPVKPLAFKPWGPSLLGFLAIALIVFYSSQGQIAQAYPNGYAAFFCLATAYLIALPRLSPANAVTPILAAKPLVGLGLISYSLYIWHWPILAMLRYLGWQLEGFLLLPVLVAIVVIAYLSWRYFETPLRRGADFSVSMSLCLLLIIPISTIHLASLFVKLNQGFPQRFNADMVKIYEAIGSFRNQNREQCIQEGKISHTENCWLGSQDPRAKKALMIGDSFANHLWGFMDQLGKAADIRIQSQSISSCLTLPGIAQYNWWYFKNRVYQACVERNQAFYSKIQGTHYDYVIIGAQWANYLAAELINHSGDPRSRQLSEQRYIAALEAAIQKIEASGAIPILLKQTAANAINNRDCFFQQLRKQGKYQGECDFKFSLSEEESWVNLQFAKLQKQHPALRIIDPKKVQCPGKICPVAIDGVPIYRDIGHINDYASYRLGSAYLAQFPNWLL